MRWGHNMTRLIFAISVVAGMFASAAMAAPKSVSANWNADYSISNSRATLFGCTNTGASISFTGDATVLGDVRGIITVSNNKKFTNSYTITGTAVVTLAVASGSAPINKQGGINGGVGGNPWISWEYSDGGDRVWLGRCVQGASQSIDRNGNFLNSLVWTVGTSNCSPSQSAVNNSSANRPTGVNGTIFLQNSLTNPQQTGDVSGSLSAGLVNLGNIESRTSRSQNNLAGGNPHIYVKLQKATAWNNGVPSNWSTLRPSNSDIDGDVYLGRCKDLLQ